MGRRWWLENTVKVAFLGAIAWAVSSIIGDHPRWAIYAGLVLIVLFGFPLWPYLPREGKEDEFTFKQAITMPFLIAGVLLLFGLVIGFLFTFIFVLPHVLTPVLQPIVENLEANKIAVLLFLILVFLMGIYVRLGERK